MGTIEMKTSVKRSIQAALVAGALAIAMFLALFGTSPRSAQAAETPYCGGWLGAKLTCAGAARWFNAQYGTGQHGSVCVGNGQSGAACSGGPGQGVYHPVGIMIHAQPWISNNMWSGNNLVHGITFTP